MPESIEQPIITPKPKVEVKCYRRDGETFFWFKVDEKISAMYKKQALEERESDSWPGLKFYFIPSLTDNQEYKHKLQGFNLFDNFGSSIYRNRQFNIAWLRIVGGQGEVKIDEMVSFSEANQLIKNAMSFIKEYFEDYFREFEISGTVNVNFQL